MLQDSQITLVQQSQKINQKLLKNFGVVYSVVLDETHPLIKNSDNQDTSLIGSIEFRFINGLSNDNESLPVALPFIKNVNTLPLRNEYVEIYEGPNGQFYYKRIGADSTPYTTVIPTTISKLFFSEPDNQNLNNDYSRTSSTGIQRTSNSDTKEYDGFGNYFSDLENSIVHRLKLYEGDTLIESRFGQSLRFSAYNNSQRVYSPTIIIRNSENQSSLLQDIDVSTEEDINKDGSSIVMGSNEYVLPFVPGALDDKNSSDFETKPNSFQNYPQTLKGDQILINSGRVIISAKSSEMIFYSKGNYGFISDGGLSIDNRLGIDVSVGGNINIVTNDRDIVFYTGDGSIFLGNKNLEPIVKGQQLVDILGELIDAIGNLAFLTPAGPSAVGPINLPQFGAIKAKLNNILSKVNQTS